MAFNDNNSRAKSKNQFAARIVSNKVQPDGSQNMICWVHLTDGTARKVFGVSNVTEITYAAAAEKLPALMNNDRTSVIVTDVNAELITMDVADF